jgi:SHS2 domain-containing protein
MKRYEFIEHTADIAIKIFGATYEELFVNAAYALFDLMVDEVPSNGTGKDIALEMDTLEDLLIGWLNELISLFFAEKFLPRTINIRLLRYNHQERIEANLEGLDFDPYVNKIKLEIKAATYHNVNIVKTSGGYEVVVIFDV